ncbi:MAG: cobalt transporter CbiM [Candidatus Abyssobacteria bacterium SURF_17]|uniref:Cobalt transporter CbiM n=1 Tax=Candidatus Abyssobacteria bacterium SURF_17 TaxID=2093361 RepID=A0A419F1K8_9BACT|nr:MAG: cobalt transporter CbiM [Candidatus Abyssubacteria bacterium SURF_17]
MHISEGVLSAPVLVAGGALAAAGTAYAVKKMDYDRVPQVALVSCAFFVASFIHLPVGPASVHLVLNGLAGILLGWAAFPAILVALFLQGILFQFGGLTTLGVNTLNMALPAVVCYILFGRLVRGPDTLLSASSAFACGALAVLLGGLMLALSLVWSEESFLAVAKVALLAHLPVMVIEGIITMLIVGFLKKVKPELLEAPYARPQSSNL